MSDHALAEIFMVVSIVLAIALLFKAQEASHWKHSYETLRNEVLAQGKHESKRVIRGLQDVSSRYVVSADKGNGEDYSVEAVAHKENGVVFVDKLRRMTLDEFVDSQG